MDLGCIGAACLIAARLTSLEVTTDNGLPTTAYSYDGEARDISMFYDNQEAIVSATGSLYFDTNTKVDLGYNTGIVTNKLEITDTFQLGVTQLFSLDEQSSIAVGASAAFGGKQVHKPCLDSYQREYYCGNLTAWSDFKEPTHENPYSLSVRYSYKF